MDKPGYVDLHQSGELARRIEAAWTMLEHCQLCPHCCGVNRLRNELGVCRMGDRAKVSSWTLHHWEEPPISGTRGSGTIFFSGCTGRCLFCQNYPISQLGYGETVSDDRLAAMMLELQAKGAHNINFVTPTHFMPHIMAALAKAIDGGLRLPLVYNTSGYECAPALQVLAGVIDLWLPDAKYADNAVARRLSGFGDYLTHNRNALREIYRQVGSDLRLDSHGIAVRGMIVRHLVLPGGLAGTPDVLSWIARNLSREIHVSLMDQYFPAHRAIEHPALGRRVSAAEYEVALQSLFESGLQNGWCQETVSSCDWP